MSALDDLCRFLEYQIRESRPRYKLIWNHEHKKYEVFMYKNIYHMGSLCGYKLELQS